MVAGGAGGYGNLPGSFGRISIVGQHLRTAGKGYIFATYADITGSIVNTDTVAHDDTGRCYVVYGAYIDITAYDVDF